MGDIVEAAKNLLAAMNEQIANNPYAFAPLFAEIAALQSAVERHDEKVRATDWNGAQMPDLEPAKGDPTAGLMRDAANEIERLRLIEDAHIARLERDFDESGDDGAAYHEWQDALEERDEARATDRSSGTAKWEAASPDETERFNTSGPVK